ncbi:MAG: Hsp20/alpha crystallin family protein [Candidatus Shapirobacteria bacterium]|nr:Hsp20/alpha crystallin family protein [Candidatus Shapirobacteria bacterium]MDD4382944.1 Hsp20/alpha crystallin family protein [Candidatus Shapirobacteria bacterium]
MLVPKKLLMTPWFPSDLDSWWNDDLITSNNDNGLSISEDEKGVYVKAAVPGIDPKDIDITYNKGILTIKGEMIEKEEKKKIIRQSRQSFYYQLTVPGDIDDKAEPEAKCKNGMMTVTFAKSPKVQPKKITIKAE